MQRITFGRFLERTTVYERTPVQIDSGLRLGVYLSLVTIGLLWGFYQVLPDGNYLRTLPLFQWTDGWLSGTWDFVAHHRQVLTLACISVFAATIALAIPTHFYREAEIGLHAALFVPIVFTASNVILSAIVLLPLVVNIVIWLLIAMLTLLVGLLLIGILFHMALR